MEDNQDFTIGFGKPPKSSQFKKGESGNPKGRPKGSQNLAALFEKTFSQKVTITENGRTRVVSKVEAMFLQMANKAAKGDVKASHEVRYWSQRFEDFPQSIAPLPVTHESDEAVMEGMMKRMKETILSEAKSATNLELADQSQGEKLK